MCTVSYLPKNNGDFILTSNRDEKILRPTNAPKFYKNHNCNYAFPKDKKANGSWIGMSESGRVCCLLNGAFEKHNPSDKYTYSRGLVLLDALKSTSAISWLFSTDLTKVEPFTLIIAENYINELAELYEFRWNGNKKFYKVLNASEPHIWSSATLYNNAIQKRRKLLFQQWLKNNTGNILSFHKLYNTEKKEDNIFIQSNELLQTVSITQIIKTANSLTMEYSDMLANKITKLNTNIYECEKV